MHIPDECSWAHSHWTAPALLSKLSSCACPSADDSRGQHAPFAAVWYWRHFQPSVQTACSAVHTISAWPSACKPEQQQIHVRYSVNYEPTCN